MAYGVWDRMVRFLGFGPEDDEEDEEIRAQVAAASDWRDDARTTPAPRRQRNVPADNVVSLSPSRNGAQVKVLVVEPKSFDDVQAIADQLKNRRPIILNLEHVDRETAHRMLNFLHGAIYALGGETQRVAAGIFFFAPPGVDVANLSRGVAGSAIAGGAFGADPDRLDLNDLDTRLFPPAPGTPQAGVGAGADERRDGLTRDWEWRR